MSSKIANEFGPETYTSLGETAFVVTQWWLNGFSSGLFAVNVTGMDTSGGVQVYVAPVEPASGNYSLNSCISGNNPGYSPPSNFYGVSDGGYVEFEPENANACLSVSVNLRSTSYQVVMVPANTSTITVSASLVALA
jgi:hypothetical protein